MEIGKMGVELSCHSQFVLFANSHGQRLTLIPAFLHLRPVLP